MRVVSALVVLALGQCDPGGMSSNEDAVPSRPIVPTTPKPPEQTRDEVPGLDARLVRVTDGDTIVVQLAGNREQVRLIGIDTPETKHSPRGPEPFADEATAALERLLGESEHVVLRLDAEERDRYGRLLAYVYASDGRFVNEALVREGWARAIRIPPNVRHAKAFEALATQARKAARGMWAEAPTRAN